MTPTVKWSPLTLLACMILLSYAAEAAPLVENGTIDSGAIPGGLPMSINDSVRVLMIADRGALVGKLIFALCGEESCSAVLVTGYKQGVLGYAFLRCNTNSVGVGDNFSIITERAGPQTFDGGIPLVFLVSLRANDQYGLLVVSVEGDDHATVSFPLLDDGERELKISSNVGSVELLNQDQRIDGHVMQIGDEVAVHLCSIDAAELTVGLCGVGRCSLVVVYGLDQDGQLLYRTGMTEQANQLYAPTTWSKEPEPGWGRSTFVAKEHRTFVVSRVSDKEMQFWLEEAPENVVSVELDKDSAVLKEAARYGNVILRATDDESFSCPAATLPPEEPETPPTPDSGPATTSGASSVVSESYFAAVFTASLLFLASVR